MSIKDNFRQALRELLGQGEAAPFDEAEASSEETSSAPSGNLMTYGTEAYSGPQGESVSYGYIPDPEARKEDEFEEATTVIGTSTVVSGDISSLANMQISGAVKGNVSSTKALILSGKVKGNIQVDSMYLLDGSVRGNVFAKGAFKMTTHAMLAGNLLCETSDIDGRLTGNVQSDHAACIRSNTILQGDIKTRDLMVESGAKLQGFVNVYLPEENEAPVSPPGTEDFEDM